jgi:uncharacterized membrane protein
MSIAIQSFTRTLLAASLAVVGTITSFGVTTSPAHAQGASRGSVASLAVRLEAPRQVIINETLWKCAADRCTTSIDTSRPARSCSRLAKKIGPFTSFATPQGEFSAEDLQRCNAAA